VPLPILDITTHSWYREVQNVLSRMQSLDQAGITLGYSCTGDYSFPLINLSPSAGDGLQGLLTGRDLLVYHILARLTCDVRTRIVLDEPPVIRRSPERRPRPIVIPDSQDDTQDTGNGDDEEETQDAADLPRPDLPERVWWLNQSPWTPSGLWREMLLSVGPGRGMKGLEGRPCVAVIVATLASRANKRHATSPTSTTAMATATARAISPPPKRRRLLEDDSQMSLPSSSQPPGSQRRSLGPGDDGYIDLVDGLDLFRQPRICPGCHGCSQCTSSSLCSTQDS